MKSEFAVAGHWAGGWDEPGIIRWVEGLRARLGSAPATLAIVFITPSFFERASEVLEVLRVHGRLPLLVGCSSTGVIANDAEYEDAGGIALALYHLPGAELHPVRFDQDSIEALETPAEWHGFTGIQPEASRGWLVFADPFHLEGDDWLRKWNRAYPGIATVGGLASGDWEKQRTQVYLNGEVFEEGGVALSVCGAVALESVLSQGCTPIGETWIITKTDRQFLVQIANRPAYAVLVDTFNALSKEDQAKTQGNLFVGLASTEYRDEFKRGDFVVRNLLGADPEHGLLAIGAMARPGQTLQFHRRDAVSATEDLCWVLSRARERLANRRILGGFLCSCNGRGTRMFGKSNHDAGLIREQLGSMGLVGFYCAGELGPVGGKTFLHAYTASLGLFVADPEP